MKCRHCSTPLEHIFANLEFSPIANAMLTEKTIKEPETFYPLTVYICNKCWLAQVPEMKKANEIFNQNYTYFSSFSTSWLNHAKKYVDMITKRFDLDSGSQVIEIASNDGYLLQYFQPYSIPVLGIEPSSNTAEVAIKKGIPSITEFFSSKLARQEIVAKKRKADLLIGNNVLAHVPDINDFVKGMKISLAKNGVITMEFAYLIKLVENTEFDTIYHEHFSYLSLTSVKKIFESFDLEIFDACEIPCMGGGLRIYAKHKGDVSKPTEDNVAIILEKEHEAGADSLKFYLDFQKKILDVKYKSMKFLVESALAGKKIIGYGAAAKGNTFLNYLGIRGNDIIRFVADASPYKQNKYLPGSHIPVVEPNKIKEYKPDLIILLPWNLKKEICEQLSYIHEWGGKIVTLIPELSLY